MAQGCDQCQVLRINGIPTHEQGCPNSHIDPSTGKGYLEKCPWCDRNFRAKYKGQDKCYRPGCESYRR